VLTLLLHKTDDALIIHADGQPLLSLEYKQYGWQADDVAFKFATAIAKRYGVELVLKDSQYQVPFG